MCVRDYFLVNLYEPVAVFVAQLFEVTVIVTVFRIFVVAPVIVNVVAPDAAASLVWVKKAFPPASGFALTVIVAPADGRPVTVTDNGKSGPGAGGSVTLTAGELVKPIPVSVQAPPPPPLDLLQDGVIPRSSTKSTDK